MLPYILDGTSHLRPRIFVSCRDVSLPIHSSLSRMFLDAFSEHPLAAARSRFDQRWHSNANLVYRHRWRFRTVIVDCVETAPPPCGGKKSKYHPLHRHPSMVQWWTRSWTSHQADRHGRGSLGASKALRDRRVREYSYLEDRDGWALKPRGKICIATVHAAWDRPCGFSTITRWTRHGIGLIHRT